MSISYSGVVGYGSGKVTLPSVETWGTNMSMLRDPPKSIMTRRIDKVGETSDITQMIEDAGNRVNESILVYPRGVNPMVGISFDNYGNNGGQRSGGTSTAGLLAGGGTGKQSYLPHRIIREGAFRPPQRSLRELLPLSRQPRALISNVFASPSYADFSKKILTPQDENRAVRNAEQMLRGEVRPTATYKLEAPIIENYEMTYTLKNPLKVPMNSGITTTARFNGEFGEPVKQIMENPLRPVYNVNYASDTTKTPTLENFNTEKYTHDRLHGEMGTNAGKNIQITSIDEIYNTNVSPMVKDSIHTDYTAPMSGYEKHEIQHDDIYLQRRVQLASAQTQATKNIHTRLDNPVEERTYTMNRPMTSAVANFGGNHMKKQDDINSRTATIRPTISAGGYTPNPQRPLTYQENNAPEFDQRRAQMRQQVYDMQAQRGIDLGNIPYRIAETVV